MIISDFRCNGRTIYGMLPAPRSEHQHSVVNADGRESSGPKINGNSHNSSRSVSGEERRSQLRVDRIARMMSKLPRWSTRSGRAVFLTPDRSMKSTGKGHSCGAHTLSTFTATFVRKGAEKPSFSSNLLDPFNSRHDARRHLGYRKISRTATPFASD